jgi:flagellin
MRINTNVSSLTAIEASTNNEKLSASSLEKLSTGLRINKASDDASGMAIADKLRTQASTISQGINNANSANTMIQIADKAMGEQSNILDIVHSKLLQASTSTTSDDGRQAIAKDINALLTQLDNIATSTNYNGVTLLQESDTSQGAAVALTFQVGDKDTDVIKTAGSIQSNTAGLAKSAPTDNLRDLKNDTGGDGTGLTQDNALSYLDVVNLAITDLNTMRSNFGATQNQIESATRNMLTSHTNIKAAESIIRDVDYSQESANFSKYNIVGQASTYAQSQANAIPKNVLQFLQ